MAEVAGVLRAARRPALDVDQHDWQMMTAKRFSQRCGVFHHLADGMHGGVRQDAFLQIDDDQGGLRVERGHWHAVLPFVKSERHRRPQWPLYNPARRLSNSTARASSSCS